MGSLNWLAIVKSACFTTGSAGVHVGAWNKRGVVGRVGGAAGVGKYEVESQLRVAIGDHVSALGMLLTHEGLIWLALAW